VVALPDESLQHKASSPGGGRAGKERLLRRAREADDEDRRSTRFGHGASPANLTTSWVRVPSQTNAGIMAA